MLESLELNCSFIIKHDQAFVRPSVFWNHIWSMFKPHTSDLNLIRRAFVNIGIISLKVNDFNYLISFNVNNIRSFYVCNNSVKRIKIFHKTKMAYLFPLLRSRNLFFLCTSVMKFSMALNAFVEIFNKRISFTYTTL